MDTNERRERTDELVKHYEGMSTGELRDHFIRLMNKPELQRLWEGLTPRIYVSFTQAVDVLVDEQGVGRPVKITLGPYIDIELTSGKMHVTAGGEEECQSFSLATARGTLWEVHDGLERAAPFIAWARFHTVVPAETPRKPKGK